MLEMLRQIVVFETIHSDEVGMVIVTDVKFKQDFGPWKRNQWCQLIQIVVIEDNDQVWMEELFENTCVQRIQIGLKVI